MASARVRTTLRDENLKANEEGKYIINIEALDLKNGSIRMSIYLKNLRCLKKSCKKHVFRKKICLNSQSIPFLLDK
jgi:hypothetical protein